MYDFNVNLSQSICYLKISDCTRNRDVNFWRIVIIGIIVSLYVHTSYILYELSWVPTSTPRRLPAFSFTLSWFECVFSTNASLPAAFILYPSENYAPRMQYERANTHVRGEDYQKPYFSMRTTAQLAGMTDAKEISFIFFSPLPHGLLY